MATHPTEYAHPEALVETDWLEKHLQDDGIRVIESNEDILLYDTGHIPGAVHIDWRADLQDPVIRDYISPEKFARLCNRHGITPDTTCIFYGDKANWWACYALWAFRLFGHEKVKILNGGRDKWKAEGRPMTREIPEYPKTDYPVPKKRFDKEIRAFFNEALDPNRFRRRRIESAGHQLRLADLFNILRCVVRTFREWSALGSEGSHFFRRCPRFFFSRSMNS